MTLFKFYDVNSGFILFPIIKIDDYFRCVVINIYPKSIYFSIESYSNARLKKTTNTHIVELSKLADIKQKIISTIFEKLD